MRTVTCLLLVLLAGCGREVGFANEGEGCVRSTECMAGLACVAGRCSADLSGLEGGTLPPRPVDAGPTPDAGPGVDAGPGMDAGMDAGAPPPDAGPRDSGPPDSGPPPMPDSGPPPMPDGGPPPTPDAGPMIDGG
jgi:hypothetical protein